MGLVSQKLKNCLCKSTLLPADLAALPQLMYNDESMPIGLP